MKPPIRLLALDLDDTLLREDLTIAPEDLRSLRAAEDLGVQLVLASGRTPEGMHRYLRELELDRREGWFISYNGAQIQRTDTGTVEWQASLDPDLSRGIFDFCASRGVPIQCYRQGQILVTQDNLYSEMDTQLTGQPRKVVGRKEFFQEEPIKLVIPMEPQALAAFSQELLARFPGKANMYISKPFYFEVVPPGADKGKSLERLAQAHDIPRESVMAMGDALNDEGMMRWAGLPVAPANARPEIQKLAHWVCTRTHNEGAVTEAVHRFILGGY